MAEHEHYDMERGAVATVAHAPHSRTAHAGAASVAASERHGGHTGHADHGDHIAIFRRRFWWSLLLTVPIVATSHMVMDWFGYSLRFPGSSGSDRCSARCSISGPAGRSSPAARARPVTSSPE
jgi:Cu2+-exporting ATPase